MNKSKSNSYINSLNFKVQDSTGAQETAALPTYSLDDQFESVTLSSDGVREGSLIFEVKKDDENLKFIYVANSLTNKNVEINLK